MSDDDSIDKLEALLERVRSRNRPPSDPPPLLDAAADLEVPTPIAAFLPSPLPPEPSTPHQMEVATPVSAFRPSSMPPSSAPSTQPLGPRRDTLRPGLAPGLFGLGPQEPPRMRPLDAPPPFEPPPMEVVELDVESIPSVPPPPHSGPLSAREDGGGGPPAEALESRSRLVSAPPLAAESAEAHDPSAPVLEIASAEISATELEALDADRPPTSSRRPISMEAKMNEPDDAPLHEPPPESGKLLAAAPAIELEGVKPSLTPRPEVAVFVGTAGGKLAATTFGDVLDEALTL